MKGEVDALSSRAKIRYVSLEYYSILRNIFIADPPKRGRRNELKLKNTSYSDVYWILCEDFTYDS